jgi:hypothetical protein
MTVYSGKKLRPEMKGEQPPQKFCGGCVTIHSLTLKSKNSPILCYEVTLVKK